MISDKGEKKGKERSIIQQKFFFVFNFNFDHKHHVSYLFISNYYLVPVLIFDSHTV